ncbi:MAG: class II fructose-1,6-bisphosphate aldolase [Mycoplasma sp.]|nr:class II fructose-1,6-bisphosphate aldolase [Mycoplasma sp.]
MNKEKSNFVSMNEMIDKAVKNKYAIAHINTNNLEWTKAILEVAQETKTPIIIGVSEGAAKYQCGYKTVFNMINSMMEFMNITVPIVLHLDHGTYEGTFKAIDAGFSSVMFDGSKYSFEENMKKTIEVVEYAKKFNVSVEAEIGSIGGEEDGVIGMGEIADPEQCEKMAKLDITVLAAGIGNVHGLYPDNWKGLNFNVLEQISKKTGKGIVLHGGSGIPDEQIKKSISLGIAKVNVNTECQLAFSQATRKYIENKGDLDNRNKGYDPRKVLKPGFNAIKETVIEKIRLFGSYGKA